ncbi:MAG: hypothetical protein HY329_25645 [Chloroflexi bacterium]|nr:hypothetical protein [Chloroflexota bacterium]
MASLIANPTGFAEEYASSLGEYLKTRSEAALYRASLLSQTFIEQGLGPEEIIALHVEALDELSRGQSYREQARASGDAHQFLLEVMIAYGVQYKQYMELRMVERERQTAAAAATERQRAADAERAEQEKTDILATVAHELRTPMTAAMGNLDLALRLMDGGKVERLPRLLTAARNALGRLARLSTELMKASQGEDPQLPMSGQYLNEILTQAFSWIAPTASDKGVDLRREETAELTKVWGNSDALLTVFNNLLTNAVRYTPKGGQVVVRSGRDGNLAWVEVADTGIGMTPEVKVRIFEKFYRAPEAQFVEAKGLGLGLALVQRLVHAHAGRIEVESRPGAGSTFRVRLPLHESGVEEVRSV